MIRSFGGRGARGTEDIFNGVDSRYARSVLPQPLWERGRRKLDDIDQSEDVTDLRTPAGNRLHQLRGSRSGWWAVRLNDQFRICFRPEGPDMYDVEITDYH